MSDKEWLTRYELAERTGYDPKWLSKLANDGSILEWKTVIHNGNRRLFHSSLVDELIEKRKHWNTDVEDEPPEGLIKYDGFELTLEMIYDLEAIRNANGYRAIHWTDKTVEQLIAEGGDAEEWKL